MQKLMHKPDFKISKLLAAGLMLCSGPAAFSQTDPAQIVEQINYLIDDAIFFSDKYVTPATDAAVYQASSGWISSPKKTELWDVSFGIHANVFMTPHKDRSFVIHNSDFSFFQLEEGTSAQVPTALGNDNQVYLTGQLGDSQVRLETPQGMDMNVVAYPYLQGSVGLPFGTELVVKYSTRVKLKKSEYQVYGVGLKYNFSQYFETLNRQKINLAVLAGYGREDVSFGFLDVQTDFGTLGINTINGSVDTWQFQLSGSQEFGNVEFMCSFITNVSDVKYNVSGPTGSIEEILPLQQVLNQRLHEIYKTRTNYIGEVSTKYNFGHFDLQGIVAFGKFVNANVSLHYLIK